VNQKILVAYSTQALMHQQTKSSSRKSYSHGLRAELYFAHKFIYKVILMNKYLSALGRIFLASTFLGVVVLKLIAIQSSPEGYAQYKQMLSQVGLGENFAPLLILIELIGGATLFLGFKTKLSAYILAALAVFMAVVVGRFSPETFFIYIGLAGGFLTLALNPNTTCSLDNLKK
jgi:putative oxidoreductase